MNNNEIKNKVNLEGSNIGSSRITSVSPSELEDNKKPGINKTKIIIILLIVIVLGLLIFCITKNNSNKNANTKDLTNEVLQLINEKRKLHGVQPLTLNQTINKLAIESASSLE